MDFEKWRPWYERIVAEFGFDRDADQRSADLLDRLLAGKAVDPSEIRHLVEDMTVVIFGCGPSVERNLREFQASTLDGKAVTIAADGATTPVLRTGRFVPDIIVTDLDGRVRDIAEARRKGAIIAVHAHGDNMPALRRWVPVFASALGTTQVEPRTHVHNFGGFTDGDRAAFLAEEARAARIILAGMDLGTVVGKYSKPGHAADFDASPEKARKLSMAKELLTWLASWAEAEILNATGLGEKIEGLKNAPFSSL